MQHGDFLVRILDDHGNPAGYKPRREVDKRHDIVHCADVILVHGEHIVLALLPAGDLYGGMWSPTCATMIRQNETPEEAAHRALSKELNIFDAQLQSLGDHFFAYPDGVKRLKSTFVCRVANLATPNPNDVAELREWTPSDLARDIGNAPENFAPTFLGIWHEYAPHLTAATK